MDGQESDHGLINIHRIIQEANQEIKSALSDEGAEKRYWKVEGFSQVPCGGIHLKGTGEIGKIAKNVIILAKAKKGLIFVSTIMVFKRTAKTVCTRQVQTLPTLDGILPPLS
jgi:Ser-tRNA(Ala) deacylase AlaX